MTSKQIKQRAKLIAELAALELVRLRELCAEHNSNYEDTASVANFVADDTALVDDIDNAMRSMLTEADKRTS